MIISGKGIWELGEKGEGIKKYKLVVIGMTTNGGHWEIKYSIGNMVNNSVTTIVITIVIVFQYMFILKLPGRLLFKLCEYLTTMLYTCN